MGEGGGTRIRIDDPGPLETIGDMCRSLRELNRPDRGRTHRQSALAVEAAHPIERAALERLKQ